jgi:hypothetical protein
MLFCNHQPVRIGFFEEAIPEGLPYQAGKENKGQLSRKLVKERSI